MEPEEKLWRPGRRHKPCCWRRPCLNLDLERTEQLGHRGRETSFRHLGSWNFLGWIPAFLMLNSLKLLLPTIPAKSSLCRDGGGNSEGEDIYRDNTNRTNWTRSLILSAVSVFWQPFPVKFRKVNCCPSLLWRGCCLATGVMGVRPPSAWETSSLTEELK